MLHLMACNICWRRLLQVLCCVSADFVCSMLSRHNAERPQTGGSALLVSGLTLLDSVESCVL